jgi:hypothetical protein
MKLQKEISLKNNLLSVTHPVSVGVRGRIAVEIRNNERALGLHQLKTQVVKVFADVSCCDKAFPIAVDSAEGAVRFKQVLDAELVALAFETGFLFSYVKHHSGETSFYFTGKLLVVVLGVAF